MQVKQITAFGKIISKHQTQYRVAHTFNLLRDNSTIVENTGVYRQYVVDALDLETVVNISNKFVKQLVKFGYKHHQIQVSTTFSSVKRIIYEKYTATNFVDSESVVAGYTDVWNMYRVGVMYNGTYLRDSLEYAANITEAIARYKSVAYCKPVDNITVAYIEANTFKYIDSDNQKHLISIVK